MGPIRPLGRTTVIATGLIGLAFIGSSLAFADTSVPDADLVAMGSQTTIDLGPVAPSAVVHRDVDFVLTCSGTNHLDPDATIAVAESGTLAPSGGSIHGTTAQIGPLTSWPLDGDACATPAEVATAAPVSDVTIVAPAASGPYIYRITYRRTVSNGDSTAVTGTLVVMYTLTVVPPNTPPTLVLPDAQTVEGNETGGASVTYAASATDNEDATAPTPTCEPASGSHFDIGTTTVACTVTDSGGLTASGSFDVTVVDTTAPHLSGVPDALAAITTDSSGKQMSWPAPAATDVVDASPRVGCSPASGSTFPVGDTEVTCTATDASGNHTSRSFVVSITLKTDTYSATFDAPIGPTNSLAVNGNRSLPVKARIWVNGVEQMTGSVSVEVTACSSGPVLAATSLDWTDASGGRWVGKLDLSALADGCYHATLRLGDTAVGSFDLQPTPIAAKAKPKPKK